MLLFGGITFTPDKINLTQIMIQKLLLSALLFAGSCANPAGTIPNREPSINPTATETKPDGNDLLQLLQGRWQSDSDPTYILEFQDNKALHLVNEKPVDAGEVIIDGTCAEAVCASDVELAGWCFVEKTVAETQCFVVLKCTETVLEFRAFGAATSQLSFKKIGS